ncbi:MAG: hypothetical protein B6I18_05625 [Bacteroidetes bacterium 4572_112]|nr:MAG: hypothetical protein B6I18_05625 [Bacteroidetes bacterium 4572_112]
MDKEHSVFKLAMKPGLYAGLISVAVSIVLWATIADLDIRSKLGYLTLLIIAFLFYKFTIDYRENTMNGELSYGEGFKFQLSMSVVYAAINSIYSYILFTILDPNMIEQIKEMAAQQMYDNNMSDEQVEAALQIQSLFMTPTFMTVSTLFGTFIMGLVLALIISIFTKKEKKIFE